jgi:hypothetical protein
VSDTEGERTLITSALVIVGLVLATALLIWGGVHVMLRPVNPAQVSPENHFTGACWACHFMSARAAIVEP